MKLLLQRVLHATITTDNNTTQSMQEGVVAYIGIHNEDTLETVKKAAQRITSLTLFENTDGKLKESVSSRQGSLLIVPNFTLYGTNKKGNQLDFTNAGAFGHSQALFDGLITQLREIYSYTIITGKFGSYMDIESTVAGPVNIIIDI